MRYRWLGTAGFELLSGRTSILIDPYLTRNPRARPEQPFRPEDLGHAEAIFLTHGHFDHTLDVPELVDISRAVVYASAAVCASLAARGVPWTRLRVRWPGEAAEVAPFRVTAVPACHVTFDARLVLTTLWRCRMELVDLARLGTSRYPTGEVLGWLVEAEGRTLLHLGSACMTWIPDCRVDAFLVPVQGRTDICSVAAGLVDRVRPATVIPHHHDDFYPPLSQYVDLEPFLAEMRRRHPRARVRIPVINRLEEL
ncbi:MBL fold metallo-hydrolase [Candidatus Solincola sp.]|jgi:L-ascorbate metabolism protein UlaG (beta-lactamase superfamily)|nr:MBL fold metallo-hydrolase [Actinomycetota bacterium]MDI7251249.1 MBL fold metallo-hydrolase [Actinomycetota bacterium]